MHFITPPAIVLFCDYGFPQVITKLIYTPLPLAIDRQFNMGLMFRGCRVSSKSYYVEGAGIRVVMSIYSHASDKHLCRALKVSLVRSFDGVNESSALTTATNLGEI